MDESILITIKKLLNLSEDYHHFDLDVITHINAVFGILYQLGVTDDPTFMITGENETWEDIIYDENLLTIAKTYIAAKVRLMFDPPTMTSLSTALNEVIKETEWRLSERAEILKNGGK